MPSFAAPAGASIEGRVRLVAAIVVIVFGGFVVRLFHLQVVEGEALRQRSQRNSVRQVELEAPRGEVLDREGRTIATWRSVSARYLVHSFFRSSLRAHRIAMR